MGDRFEEGHRPEIFVISGTQGAGKTTIGGLLAGRFHRGVHISADALQFMIVSGREWPDARLVTRQTPEVAGEAGRQLRLRLRNACVLARSFHEAGFTAVIDDIIFGDRVQDLVHDLRDLPFHFVMLVPGRNTVRAREHARGTDLWREWEWLTETIASSEPRIGLWLDTSEQSPEETVAEIMRRARDEALVQPTITANAEVPA